MDQTVQQSACGVVSDSLMTLPNARTRRDWLKSVATGVSVAMLGGGVSCAKSYAARESPSRLGKPDKTQDLTVIDTHQHLWERDRLKLPWIQGNEILDKNFTTSDYLQATSEIPLTSAIYMEVGAAEADQSKEADWVLELCRDPDSPTVAGVIAGQPHSSGFGEFIGRYAEHSELKGLRHLLIGNSPKGLCLQPEYVAGIQLLGKHQWRFDLCMRPSELSDGAKLVEQCDETQFIVDHCGNADPIAFLPKEGRHRAAEHDAEQWKRDMESLAKFPNVVCKISGIVARVPRGNWQPSLLAPIIQHCRDVFGPDRLMFAGDWPVCLLGASLLDWFQAVVAITEDWERKDRLQLFSGNAKRFYELA